MERISKDESFKRRVESMLPYISGRGEMSSNKFLTELGFKVDEKELETE